MKKSLLLSLSLTAIAGIAQAEIKEPVIYEDASIQRFSADGTVAVSEVYGVLKIYDLVNGTVKEFVPDENWVNYYSVGLGNFITADGSVIVASTLSDNDAAYYANGEWHQLNVPDEGMTNLSNGITPDGSRICGSIGLSAMTLEETIMLVPAYWDRNEDGTYGEYHPLPYPTKDLFGETPQYLTAVSISADGKTIVGQMVFSSGRMAIPIVYTVDDKGEWSYSLPTASLFNPDQIEPVENPGDGPMPPSQEEYMTEEELAAYTAAVEAFFNGEISDYPEYTDFMTEEETAAYLQAYDAYLAVYEEWDEKYNAYSEYAEMVYASSPNFLFNNCLLSTDDKYIVSSLEMDDPNADPWSWFKKSINIPVSVNIETGELIKYESEISLMASGVADGGIILASNGQSSTPMEGFVIKDGEIYNLVAYLNNISPEYGQWITSNMSHEVVVGYEDETWEEIFEEMTFTGIPVATPDMSKISIWNTCPWSDQSAESVIFDLTPSSGIATINAQVKNIKVMGKGVVAVPEGFNAIAVYNLNGQCVKTLDAPCGLIKLGVAPGAYIVKGTRTDGSVSVVKLACN